MEPQDTIDYLEKRINELRKSMDSLSDEQLHAILTVIRNSLMAMNRHLNDVADIIEKCEDSEGTDTRLKLMMH